jgi:hypothetical protein
MTLCSHRWQTLCYTLYSVQCLPPPPVHQPWWHLGPAVLMLFRRHLTWQYLAHVDFPTPNSTHSITEEYSSEVKALPLMAAWLMDARNGISTLSRWRRNATATTTDDASSIVSRLISQPLARKRHAKLQDQEPRYPVSRWSSFPLHNKKKEDMLISRWVNQSIGLPLATPSYIS